MEKKGAGMISNYLSVLEDSLYKKKKILKDVQDISKKQSELLECDKLDMEQYDSFVDQKDTYIKELEKLDQGFELLYEKIKEQLLQNKSAYKEQIGRIQDLIGEVTEMNVSIQAQEARNRDMVTAHFAKERQALGQGRKSSKAAYGYYQNLNKAIREETSVMDMKK